MTPTAARVIYPELPKPLTPSDLYQLFRPSYVEREWVPTIARIPSSQVALLVQLKIFQTIGRFLGAADIPPAAIEYVASHMGVEHVSVLISRTRTFYRHRRAILQHLKVISWGHGREGEKCLFSELPFRQSTIGCASRAPAAISELPIRQSTQCRFCTTATSLSELPIRQSTVRLPAQPRA